MIDPIIANDKNTDMTMKINDDLPDYFSWKDYAGQDWTTPAKSQGNCGSCWDFAALGALEIRINIREGIADLDPDLSEQYVLSCLPNAANTVGEGCRGGDPFRAYKYICLDNKPGNYCNGIILESCMPYQASDDVPCEEKCEDWEKYLVPLSEYGYKCLWFLDFNDSRIDIIKTQIMEGGPVAAGINVTTNFSNWGYTNHNTTDYFPYNYEPWANRLNHLIVIVGWKDDDTIGNGGYWICKNEWGDNFGYDGFYNIEYKSLFTDVYIAWAEYNPEDYNWPPVPKANGPYYGLTNEIVYFAGDGEGENPPFTWHWDFGDGSTSTEQNPTHAYTSSGEFPVALTVTDDNGDYLIDGTFVWIQDNNQPPSTPIIEGPSKIKKGEYCWYNFTFDDPDDSPVYLYVHAFGLESGIFWGPYPDGYGIERAYYYWENAGEYVVKAKVKDPYGAESDWAILNVTVEKNKAIDYPMNSWSLAQLFQRFPLFEKILNQIIL
jgi:hypothetical protein